MAKITIKDIAKECEVSLSTVSLVLNNNPRISQQTRDKVLKAVKRSGYHPNIHAQGLASQSSKTLSVVVPNLNHVFADIYFGEIISGIYDYAQEINYKIMLDVANQRFIKSQEYMTMLKTRRVDGMLFIASTLDDHYLRQFKGSPYPFLMVNHYFSDLDFNYISMDYEQTATLAADHLIDLGHKKIGLIGGSNVQTTLDFIKAFLKQSKKRGLPKKQIPIQRAEFSEQGGYDAAQKLMEETPQLTAIMGANDRMAIGIKRYLTSIGKKVPHDISVMGVDDIPQAQYTTPALTTIHHELYEIGKRSAENLIKLAKKEITSCQEMIPVTLVKRESTAPPPKA